jgi:hypothetical protein
MATKLIQALNPANWLSSGGSDETSVDSEGTVEQVEEEYENAERSPLKDQRKLEDEEAEIFGKRFEEDFLDTQYDRETVMWDIRDRKNDLSDLHVQIRSHWQTYKHWLEQARGEDGINGIKAKTKAKSAKKAAKDKEQLYKLLWKELSSLKNSLRKDEQVSILGGDKYKISFTDIDSASAEEAAQRHSQVLRKRKMMVDQFRNNVERTEEDVEIDFSDIEKDVAELEMQDMEDIDIYIEGEEELEQPVPETDSEEWS